MSNLHQADIFYSEEDNCFIATTKAWIGISGFGETMESALAELKVAYSLVNEKEVEDE